MNYRSIRWAACTCLLALFFCGDPQPAACKILFRVSNAGVISLQELVAEVRDARVVIFGERHNSPDDHGAQRTLIQALHDGGVKVAIGLEMFRANVQPQLDAWVAGDLEEPDFISLFADNWDRRWWPLYRDILYYARQEKIPLVGLNVPRQIVSQVSRQGFESLSDQQKGELEVASCDVSERYQDLLGQVMGEKEQNSATFHRFCQAQLVWDVAMAQNVIKYLDRHPDTLMVLLAGSFHAWKHGIAEQLSRRSDLAYRVILPSSDESFFRYDIMLRDADYVWWLE